jgi:BlaI family transcriptional regulator, penicillinase repressor
MKKDLVVYESSVDLRKYRRYMEKLTPQEEEALKAIFKAGEGSIKSFLEHISAPQPPYTTLASTVKNLEKKGYVSSRMVGNTYVYKAAISEKEFKKNYMSGVVKNYFDNSYKELVNFFIDQKKLSPSELKEIIKMIEAGKK